MATSTPEDGRRRQRLVAAGSTATVMKADEHNNEHN
jgi:hypothetical protein